MVKLSLPLQDYNEIDEDSSGSHCDPYQSVYNRRHCIQNGMFCSDDNPCPSDIPCIDQVCQCLPNKQQFITLTPPPHRMYTLGCNFDKTRETNTCRAYEYAVESTCVLNYCSKDVPCYAGMCDTKHHVCVNMTSVRVPLPPSINQIITLDDSPFSQQKDSGYPPLLIIIAAALSVACLAIVGCLIRLLIRWARSSVIWVSRSHRLTSEGVERYDDKNGSNHPFTDAKYVTDPKDISGVTVAKVPPTLPSAHRLPPPLYPSTDSLDYATPLPSPRFAAFVQDLSIRPLQPQSQTSLTNLDGDSSNDIEMETRPFLNDQYDNTAATTTITTTTTTDIDPSRRLSYETSNMEQREKRSAFAGERGFNTSSLVVSHSIISESSGLQKSRSLHVRGSKALPPLPQMPVASAMRGSCPSAAAIVTLAHELPQASLTPPLPKSPKSPRSLRPTLDERPTCLTLSVPSPLHTPSEQPFGPTTPTIPALPYQLPFASTSSSSFTNASLRSSASRSSVSFSGSPPSPNGLPRSRRLTFMSNHDPTGYSNSPIDRNLPAGFASSPVVETTL
ncbi:hypothetical protein EC991_011462 [Linnemannia zychae]|nr:hypothetical protein EC991_011462 [Linnemannia zychae]